MTDDNGHDMTGQQKAARVALLLAQGREYSTVEIAEMFGMSWEGAFSMMDRISITIPLTKDENRGGKWYLIER